MLRNHCGRFQPNLTRRELLKNGGGGLGMFALADLLRTHEALGDNLKSINPLSPRPPHYTPKAKSTSWLFMEGAPSGVDLFDPKPELSKRHGQKLAIDVFNGKPGPLMRSPFSIMQYGQSGVWVCDRYPKCIQP